jgi:hypothetical protein
VCFLPGPQKPAITNFLLRRLQHLQPGSGTWEAADNGTHPQHQEYIDYVGSDYIAHSNVSTLL